MSNDNTNCNCDCSTPNTDATERVAYRQPSYTVRENADAFDVEVFVPGINRSGVEISLQDDALFITARRATPTPDDWKVVRREILATDYRLTLVLNVAVDEAKIEANVADGVLRVRLPKAAAAQPRRIEVR